jgi:hypothetical protein
MAAYMPSALKRAAREANGWFPVGIPIKGIGPMFEQIKEMAEEVGRDPASLELIIRANVEFTDPVPGQDRVDFTGTLEQLAGDVAATRALGAAELVFDVQFSPGVDTLDDIIVRMEQLWELSKAS